MTAKRAKPLTAGWVRRRFTRPGKLVPPDTAHLKSRAMRLRSGGAVDWHTTGLREELLLAVDGRVEVELLVAPDKIRRVTLEAGQSLFLPSQLTHRVINRSTRIAGYVYVTGG